MCSICAKGFNNKYKMRVHERNHQERDMIPPIHPDPAKNKENDVDDFQPGIAGQTPVKAKGRARMICDECDAVFPSKIAYRRHLDDQHPDLRPFKCLQCGKGFRRQKGLTHHKNYVCSNKQARNNEAPSCIQCSITFPNAKEAKRHAARKHRPELSIKCPSCPTVCKSKKTLRVHQKTAHPEENLGCPLPHQCLECGKSFLKVAYLEVLLDYIFSERA